MAANRRAGRFIVRINGVQRDAQGNWTYNLGSEMREALIGEDEVHGFTTKPQVPFIEGEITDERSLDLATLQSFEDETITLELANGKTIVLRNAWYASAGNVQTQRGNVAVRFEGRSGREIKP